MNIQDRPSISMLLRRVSSHAGIILVVLALLFAAGCSENLTESEKEEILSDLQQSAMNVIERKGATEWGPARGVAHMVEAILHDTGAVLPGSVVLDGEFGHEGVGLGVPVKLGSDGVEEIVEWDLDDFEQEQLAEAADKLSEQYEKIS